MSSLRGSCPDLAFVVSGSSVVTDGGTQFRQGNCKHLENNRRIRVAGQRDESERILAERVDMKAR